MSNPTKNILVIRLSAMGDVAILTPVLKALFKQNKDVKITILTQKFFTPIFKAFKNIKVNGRDSKNLPA